TDKPSLISVKTIIGFGMPKQGTNKAHSDAPGEDAVKETKRNLGWDENKTFHVPDEVYTHFHKAIENGEKVESHWNELVTKYESSQGELGKDFAEVRKNELPKDWENALPKFENVESKATREYSGEVINALADVLPALIGGSADLTGSNKTQIDDSKGFQFGAYEQRNIHFGVREHAMSAAMTGMALYGSLIPFGGTFFCFSDYLRPTMRLACLSEVQVIYVFTHDSIGLGEDGPTHQPVEQLASLRAIPGLFVVRPADAHETAQAWKLALIRNDAPTALILSRHKVAVIDTNKYASAEGLQKGAYILAEAESGTPQVILIATGSEIGLALEAREILQRENVQTRVVSMPCTELFDEQDESYREQILPKSITARVAIEAGVSQSWYKYVNADDGAFVTLDRFGASSPAKKLFQEFGFTPENIAEKAKSIVKK
ncbi:MAG: transketolase, partial [Pyrinomonadaceae bacterium]|nr:transketolase [Pyrinomonadaceae bacterium]